MDKNRTKRGLATHWWVFVPIAIAFSLLSFRHANSSGFMPFQATIPEIIPIQTTSFEEQGHRFLVRNDQFGASMLDENGQKLWSREFGFPLTAHSSGREISAWGFLDGSIRILDTKGSLVGEIAPETMGVATRVPCIYALAINSEGSILIALYGSGPQYLIALERNDGRFAVVANKRLRAQTKFAQKGVFASDDSHAIIATGDGIYHFDPTSKRFSQVQLPDFLSHGTEPALFRIAGDEIGMLLSRSSTIFASKLEHGTLVELNPIGESEIYTNIRFWTEKQPSRISDIVGAKKSPRIQPKSADVEFGIADSNAEALRLKAKVAMMKSDLPAMEDESVFYRQVSERRMPGIILPSGSMFAIDQADGYRSIFFTAFGADDPVSGTVDVEVAVLDGSRRSWVSPGYIISGLSDASPPRIEPLGLSSSKTVFTQGEAKKGRDRIPQGTYSVLLAASDANSKAAYSSGVSRFRIISDGKVVFDERIDSASVVESGLSFIGKEGPSAALIDSEGRYKLQSIFFARGLHVIEIVVDDFSGNSSRRTWSFDVY